MAENLDDLLEMNIATMNKPTLLIKAKELQDALKNLNERSNIDYILKRLESFEKRQIQYEADIIYLKKENKKLKKRIEESDQYLDDVDERFIDLEKQINNVDQYNRRENFEITGINESVKQDQLEAKVIDIINTITDDGIVEKDIQACHRLKKDKDGKSKVIVRMLNRKNTINTLKNRKKLQQKGMDNIFINENLSDATKSMIDVAKDLKRKKLLHSFWTFNGKLNIRLEPPMDENDNNNNNTIKIQHFCDFERYFSVDQLG